MTELLPTQEVGRGCAGHDQTTIERRDQRVAGGIPGYETHRPDTVSFQSTGTYTLSIASWYSASGALCVVIPPPLRYIQPSSLRSIYRIITPLSRRSPSKYPNTPVKYPRSSTSASRITSSVRAFGAPLTEPAGRSATRISPRRER